MFAVLANFDEIVILHKQMNCTTQHPVNICIYVCILTVFTVESVKMGWQRNQRHFNDMLTLFCYNNSVIEMVYFSCKCNSTKCIVFEFDTIFITNNVNLSYFLVFKLYCGRQMYSQ